MDITPVLSAQRQLIRSYGGGRFVINEQEYAHAVYLLPEKVTEWHFSGPADALTVENVLALLGDDLPEILLLGTGRTQNLGSPALSIALKKQGVVLDAMDTGAACRTFNVLMAEDRRVAALLMLV
jgi:uncharacterized protein